MQWVFFSNNCIYFWELFLLISLGLIIVYQVEICRFMQTFSTWNFIFRIQARTPTRYTHGHNTKRKKTPRVHNTHTHTWIHACMHSNVRLLLLNLCLSNANFQKYSKRLSSNGGLCFPVYSIAEGNTYNHPNYSY